MTSVASRLRTAWNTHRLGVDVATAIVATAAGIGSLFVEMRVLELAGDPAAIPRWSAITWTVALCLPLAVRRTRPLLSAGIIGLVFAGYRQWEVPEFTVAAIVILSPSCPRGSTASVAATSFAAPSSAR